MTTKTLPKPHVAIERGMKRKGKERRAPILQTLSDAALKQRIVAGKVLVTMCQGIIKNAETSERERREKEKLLTSTERALTLLNKEADRRDALKAVGGAS